MEFYCAVGAETLKAGFILTMQAFSPALSHGRFHF